MNIKLLIIIQLLLLFSININTITAIDCFKCVSFNNTYPPCEDPFHNNHTTTIFQSPCMGGKKGKQGLFPGTHCIKITGIFDDNQETITIRSCSSDSGSLTTDTELVRMSHCGSFIYSNRYAKGCVQSCNDADACNGVSIFLPKCTISIILLIIISYSQIMLY